MRISLQDKISYILNREPIRFSKLPDKYVLELERSGKTFASKTISWYLYTQAYNFIKSKEAKAEMTIEEWKCFRDNTNTKSNLFYL